MEEKFIPAPLDDKNVMTDWIEEVFEFGSGLFHMGQWIGFVLGCPVLATWRENVLTWSFIRGEIKAAQKSLIERLKVYEEDNPELISKIEIAGNDVVQSFFWRNED